VVQDITDIERFKEKVAGALLKGEVTLASGKKSNFYFDCRMVTLNQEGAYLAAKAMLIEIQKLGATAVGGMSIGADPLVSTIGSVAYAQGIALKLFYVRKEPKKHGKRKLIEGPGLSADDKAVIVEDVTTTGGSALKAVNAVREEFGAEVLAVLTIVDRQEGAEAHLAENNIKLISIFKADDF
jgi:orotate phosphoribosyltransferase